MRRAVDIASTTPARPRYIQLTDLPKLNALAWLKPRACGCKIKEPAIQRAEATFAKLRRALALTLYIFQGVAATKRFA
jgi:hypothetical protein